MKNAERLLEDKEFESKLAQAKTNEDIIALFAAHGVAVTETDLVAVSECEPNTRGEFSEEALEQVTGGSLAWIVRELLRRKLRYPHSGVGGRL